MPVFHAMKLAMLDKILDVLAIHRQAVIATTMMSLLSKKEMFLLQEGIP